MLNQPKWRRADKLKGKKMTIPFFPFPDGLKTLEGTCRGFGEIDGTEEKTDLTIGIFTQGGHYFNIMMDSKTRKEFPTFFIDGVPYHLDILQGSILGLGLPIIEPATGEFKSLEELRELLANGKPLFPQNIRRPVMSSRPQQYQTQGVDFATAPREVLLEELDATETAILDAIYQLQKTEKEKPKFAFEKWRKHLIEACLHLKEIWAGFDLLESKKCRPKTIQLPRSLRNLILKLINGVGDRELCDSIIGTILQKTEFL